jgi:hypothetical protein
MYPARLHVGELAAQYLLEIGEHPGMPLLGSVNPAVADFDLVRRQATEVFSTTCSPSQNQHAERLKVGNACPPTSTAIGTLPLFGHL